jgi:hypothetical protein
MKVLTAPGLKRPLWDAGRVVPPGARQSFRLSGLDPQRPLYLVVRAAPTAKVEFEISVDGKSAGKLQLEATDFWIERALGPVRVAGSSADVSFLPADHERIEYHVFAVQPAP